MPSLRGSRRCPWNTAAPQRPKAEKEAVVRAGSSAPPPSPRRPPLAVPALAAAPVPRPRE